MEINNIAFRASSSVSNQTNSVKNAKEVDISRGEVIEDEIKMLMDIYKKYMQSAGGFQEIDGRMVHVTTALHLNRKAQDFVIQLENRLRDLGALPPKGEPITEYIYK